jgi:hypothetical protein
MLDFNPLFESVFDWSRTNCIGICAFLVPANMIATLQTMIFTGLRYQRSQILVINFLAVFYAAAMILHVFTWFVVGMIMAPTFILLFLGVVCLGINIWAIAKPENIGDWMVVIWRTIINFVRSRYSISLKS